MHPDAQDILQRFHNLSSTHARQAVYRHLLDQLSLHEWRHVRDRLDQISFERDILGTLPLEIAVQITRYLDLSDLHVLQRVSKTWCLLLRSDLVRKAASPRYTGRNRSSVAGGFTEYAKQRIRLERGQPLLKLHDGADLPLPKSSDVNSLDYSHGRYAWIEEATLIVHTLVSNVTQRFCTQNRDPMIEMRLSESIIAAITPRGYCHVWDLHSEESACFRLSSVHFTNFTVCGTGVALSYKGMMTVQDDYVVHWDLNTRVARTIKIASQLGYMALNPITETLITVHLEEYVEDDPTAHQQTFSMKHSRLRVAKHPLSGSAITHPSPSYTLELPVVADSTWDVGIDEPDSYASKIGMFSNQPRGCLATLRRSILAVAYDPPTDQIAMHTFLVEHIPFFPLCMASVDHNILYYMKNDNGRPKIWVSNPGAMAPHRPSKLMNLQLPRDATGRVYSYTSGFALRGDCDFVLMVDENGIRVWCFSTAASQWGNLVLAGTT